MWSEVRCLYCVPAGIESPASVTMKQPFQKIGMEDVCVDGIRKQVAEGSVLMMATSSNVVCFVHFHYANDLHVQY